MWSACASIFKQNTQHQPLTLIYTLVVIYYSCMTSTFAFTVDHSVASVTNTHMSSISCHTDSIGATCHSSTFCKKNKEKHLNEKPTFDCRSNTVLAHISHHCINSITIGTILLSHSCITRIALKIWHMQMKKMFVKLKNVIYLPKITIKIFAN